MMKYYILPVVTINGSMQPLGMAYIHHALLTYDHERAYLIQDPTLEEHSELADVCLEHSDATPEEAQRLMDFLATIEPIPYDTLRAEAIMAKSPDVITQPEIWELLRIFGRRMGYRVD